MIKYVINMGEYAMTSIKRESAKRRQKKYARRHRRSVTLIGMTLVMLICVVSVNSWNLHKKNQEYLAQEVKLEEQIQAEEKRTEELEEMKEYVGSDAYVEDMAKERLGLAYEDEILFQAYE